MSVRHPVDNTSGLPSGPKSPHRRRVWWIIASAALAVLIVVLVVAAVAGGISNPAGIGASSSPGRLASPASSAVPSPSPSAAAPPASEAPAAEPAPPAERAPVPLTDSVAAVPGVVFSIGTIDAIDGVARGPGEVGGPALRFTVTVRNDTQEAVSLTSTVVNLFFGAEQNPATELTASGSAAFPASVAPGSVRQGVFVFTVPSDERDQVRIAVDYSVGVPIVLFEGAAPR
jgi:hypothetical protein